MKRSYLIGLLIILFAAPGIGAYFVYQHPEWLPATTNRGRLLQPPQSLTVLSHRTKWQLLYWHPTLCDAQCAQHMDDLARVRLALGRRLRQIDTVLLVNAKQAAISKALRYQLETEGSGVLSVATADDQLVLGNEPAIYIANPQHSVILVYASGQPLDDIFQDLKQVVHDK